MHNAQIRRNTNLDRTEDPQDKGLHNDKGSGSDTQGKIYANVIADTRVRTVLAIGFRPIFKPYVAP